MPADRLLRRLASSLYESWQPPQAESTDPDGPGALLDERLLRRLEKLSLATRQPAAGGLVGEHRGRRRASALEFADFRPYVPGDDFRRIDWNAYARLGELLVKVTEAREDLTLHLLVDCSASMDWGRPNKRRFALQVAAGLAYIGLCRLDAVLLAGVGDGLVVRSPRFRGKGRAAQVFRFLEGLTRTPTTQLEASVGAYIQRRLPGGIAILLSDLLADGLEEAIGLLRKARLQVVVVQVLSAEERKPDLGGDVRMVDVESGHSLEVSLTPDTLRRYQAEMNSWQAGLADMCMAHDARFVSLTTDQPMAEVLLGDLRRRSVVA